MNIVQQELLLEGFKREDIFKEEVLEEGLKEIIAKKILPAFATAGLIVGLGNTAHNAQRQYNAASANLIKNPKVIENVYSFQYDGHDYTFDRIKGTATVDGKVRKMNPIEKLVDHSIKKDQKLRKNFSRIGLYQGDYFGY